MTDEAAERKRWEATMLRNQYSNYGVESQPPNVVNTDSMKENYTFIRDAYGNVVKVYGLNLENQNYELFNSSPNQSLPFLPNNMNPAPQTHANYQTNPRNYQQQQQQEFYNNENRMNFGGENSMCGGNVQSQKPPSGQNMQSMYSSNPIINQLVGNWTPGTSIYGDCFVNTTHRPTNETTHHQTYEQSQNIVNNHVTLNDQMENTMPNSGPMPQMKKKHRIIAEVKPMRMSYSDVLSKNVLSETQTNPSNTTNSNNSTSTNYNNSNQQTGNKKKQSQARSPIQFEKRSPITVISDEKVKKVQNSKNGVNGEKVTKVSETKTSNPSLTKETRGPVNVPPTENKTKKVSKKNEKSGKNKPKNNQNASKTTNEKFERDEEHYHLIPDDSNPDNKQSDENYENMYSVNYDRISTKTQSSSSSASHSKKSKHSVNLSQSGGGRSSSKQFYSKRSQKNHKSQRYQMLEKFWTMWLEYITKFILWLWSLVSDVVYLSFGIMWDKLTIGYQHTNHFVSSMCTEIGSRPNMWIKSLWSKVNSKLEKWAFWRKIFIKKQDEPVKDYYKDGKLPTTADEAMYSLLNCKGKDAYRYFFSVENSKNLDFLTHFFCLAVFLECRLIVHRNR